MIKIDEIGTIAELERIGPQWNALIAKIRPCAFHAKEQMRILLIRRSGELIGVAPLIRRQISLRRLPLGQIGFFDNSLTPFCDLLFKDAANGLPYVLDDVISRGGFDVLQFDT